MSALEIAVWLPGIQPDPEPDWPEKAKLAHGRLSWGLLQPGNFQVSVKQAGLVSNWFWFLSIVFQASGRIHPVLVFPLQSRKNTPCAKGKAVSVVNDKC